VVEKLIFITFYHFIFIAINSVCFSAQKTFLHFLLLSSVMETVVLFNIFCWKP